MLDQTARPPPRARRSGKRTSTILPPPLEADASFRGRTIPVPFAHARNRTKVLSLFYGSLLVALVVIGGLIPYTRKVTVQGVLVPGQGFVEIYSKRAGSVSDVFVQEGQLVRAGQAVARVSVDTALDDKTTLGSIQDKARASRLKASALTLQADRRAILQKRADLKARERAADAQEEILNEQHHYAEQKTEIAKARVTAVSSLVDRGIASQIQLQQWKSAVIEGQLAQLDLDQRLADLGKAREQRRIEATSLDIDTLRTSAAEASADADALEAGAAVAQQKDQLVVTDRPGRITALRAYPGAKIPAGASIAMVAPTNATLIASFQVPSRAIGQLRVGDKVSLMYDSFPYQTFGLGHGEVAQISTSPLTEAAAIADAGYVVNVRLDATAMKGLGRSWPLLPGMKAVGVIKLERRSLLAWLLDPLSRLNARRL